MNMLAKSKFEKEIQSLLNSYSCESSSNTPDYILAGYLIDCLNTFNKAVNRREEFNRIKTSNQKITL